MAVAVGTFAGSSGNGGTHTESLAFTPDIVFLTCDSLASNYYMSQGVVVGSYNHYVGISSIGGGDIWGSGKALYALSNRYATASIGTDEFSVVDGGASTLVRNNSANFGYLAIGGLDEADGRLISTSTSVNVNLGWEPDVLILISADPHQTNTAAPGNQCAFNFGVTDGTDWTYLSTISNNVAAAPGRDSNVSSAAAAASFRRYNNTTTAWDATFSGTGYTISHTSGATRHVTALALKGIEWEAFVDAALPTATPVTDTHGAGLSGAPEATVVTAANDSTTTADASWSFGFSDGTNHNVMTLNDVQNNAELNASYAARLIDQDSNELLATVTYSGSNETELNYTEDTTYGNTSSDLFGFTFRTTGAAAGPSSVTGFGHIPIGI